jgi:solute carrier family 25 phosphate transporter 3
MLHVCFPVYTFVPQSLNASQHYARCYDPYVISNFPLLSETHLDSSALDVVKTRIQIDPGLKGHSLLSGGRLIVANEGPRGLLTGFGPTAVGYLVQGGAKFAGYEYWKKTLVNVAGDQETATRYRTAIYLGASSIAECVRRPRLAYMRG